MRGKKRVVLTPGASRGFRAGIRGGLTPSTLRRLQHESSDEEEEAGGGAPHSDDDEEDREGQDQDEESDADAPDLELATPGKKKPRKRVLTELEKVRNCSNLILT